MNRLSRRSLLGRVLRKGPKPGEPTTGKEVRSLAITPDGHFAFAAQVGDSAIVAIDTPSESVTKTLDVLSTMAAGGHLVVVQPGMTATDLMAR